jgi:glucose-6-phosphate isomerase
MTPHMRLTDHPAWTALAAHHGKIRDLHLRQLFADDPTRGERMTLEAVGIYLDFSKNRITDETIGLFVQLANESGLAARVEAMFRGDKINVSEERAVLHIALIVSAAASGRVTPAGEYGMSSISASAAPTSGPSWRMRLSSTTATAL